MNQLPEGQTEVVILASEDQAPQRATKNWESWQWLQNSSKCMGKNAEICQISSDFSAHGKIYGPLLRFEPCKVPPAAVTEMPLYEAAYISMVVLGTER